MNLLSHILVAIIFIIAFIFKIRSDKINALIYTVAASFQLVFSGLCINPETYFICIIWSIVDLLLFAYIYISKKAIKTPSLVIVQIIFAFLWIYFYILGN